jgi:uncharacterized SAM-binding protein YcdF (DUF218 family)
MSWEDADHTGEYCRTCSGINLGCIDCATEKSGALSDRERFLVTLAYQRPSHADVIVCLAGEDGENRALVAAELFKMGMAPGILVTGGLDRSPHLGALPTTTLLYGRGIVFDRIVTDASAANTREQAVNTIDKAQRRGWKRLILVASAYHMPRAYLTFLKALQDARAADVCVVPAAVLGADRFTERLALECEKIDRYGDTGDVASYADGLAYLARWAT